MKVTKNNNEFEKMNIHMTMHEYTDLQEVLQAWSKEHLAGDGTCSINEMALVKQIIDTNCFVGAVDETDRHFTNDELETIYQAVRCLESEHGDNDMTAMIMLKLEELLK